MDSIVLTAETNPVEQFEQYYKFISEQIIEEIGRIATLRKLKNDSTPVRVEEDLRDAILRTLQRFELYDNLHTIAYGYKISAGKTFNVKKYVDDKLPDMFPHPVSIEFIKTDTHHVHNVAVSDTDVFISRINTHPIELVQVDNNWKPGWFLDQVSHEKVFEMMQHADETINDISINDIASPMFAKKEMIPVRIRVFRVMKSIASVATLKDMNVTVETMVDMLWGSLIETAINLEATMTKPLPQ